MTCREKRVHIQTVSRPYVDQITTGGLGVPVQQSMEIPGTKDFRTFLVFISLPEGVNPVPGNVPTAIRLYGLKATGTTPCLLVDKCLTNASDAVPTDWNGEAFLEIDDTDLGSALADGDCDDFTLLQVEMEGPDTIVYDVIVQGHNAKFASEENISQEFTYA